MVVLLAAYNSDGMIGRCDAKCYDAEHPDCDCICAGRNHGAGLVKAQVNTAELAIHWLKKAGADVGQLSMGLE